jgi:hypothetical protein
MNFGASFVFKSFSKFAFENKLENEFLIKMNFESLIQNLVGI